MSALMKPLLLSLLLLAPALIVPSAASAEEPVELLAEATGVHCDPNCEFDVSLSSTTLTAHFMGAEFLQANCDITYRYRINESGEGEAFNQKVMAVPGQSCPWKPCEATGQETGNGHHWPAHIKEIAGREFVRVTECFDPLAGGTRTLCTVDWDIEGSGTHDLHFAAVDQRCAETVGAVTVEVNGEANAIGSAIELAH